MAQGIPILKDAPYNVLTVPNYVRSLVVTTKPAQVIAAYTAPPGVEAWSGSHRALCGRGPGASLWTAGAW